MAAPYFLHGPASHKYPSALRIIGKYCILGLFILFLYVSAIIHSSISYNFSNKTINLYRREEM